MRRTIFLRIMKRFFGWIILAASMVGLAGGSVRVDEEAFGKSLGGWTKKDNKVAEYPLSGAVYRTYRPEITPTPEGGIFVSLRIDHVRNWMSSDDHAVLEVTVSPKGAIVSARSTIAFQGVSIASDMILGGSEAGNQLLGTKHTAVQVGSDLVANLSAKLLRENIVEPGRVSYPAVLHHNYNLLFQALRLDDSPDTPPPPSSAPDPTPPAAAPEKAKPVPAAQPPGGSPTEVKPSH